MRLVNERSRVDLTEERSTFLPEHTTQNAIPRTFHKVIDDPTKARLLVGIKNDNENCVLHLDKCSIQTAQDIMIKMEYRDVLVLDCGGSAQLFYGSGAVSPSSDTRNLGLPQFDRMVPLGIMGI